MAPSTSRSHLAGIDAGRWEAVANPPEGRGWPRRAAKEENRFAAACRRAGITLAAQPTAAGESAAGPVAGAAADATTAPTVAVLFDELFYRIAEAGWTGLAESYLAGEWVTDDPGAVIARLISTGYRPAGRLPGPVVSPAAGVWQGGEIPPAAAMLAGGGLGPVCGVFASAVPTTMRQSVKSYVPGAGRKGVPAGHFVDVTRFSPPQAAEIDDYPDAIARAAGMLVRAVGCHRGTDLIDWPCAGPAVAAAAATAGASVDAVTADGAQAVWLTEALGGVPGAGRIRVDETGDFLPRNRGRYRAVTSVERLECVGGAQRKSFARAIDRLTDTGGTAAIQTVVATASLPPAALAALGVVRSYIWPGYTLTTVEGLNKLFDTHTTLSATAVVHLKGHYQQSLAFQQAEFAAGSRQAAAAGVDTVMRRLLTWQLAVKQALADLGLIEAVQITLRRRRG